MLLPEEAELLLSSPNPPSTALTMVGSLISSSRMTIDSKTHMVCVQFVCSLRVFASCGRQE